MKQTLCAWGVGVLILSLASASLADPSGAPESDAPEPAEESSTPFVKSPRPWLYTADPTAPAPKQVMAMLSVGYAQINRGAARPFAADVAHAGAVFSAGGEVGLLRHLSLHAEGLLAGGGERSEPGASPISAGAMLGASAFPLGGRGPVDIAISAGYLRELGSSNGLWFRGAIAGNLGRFRLSASALGEHVFEQGRDGVDVLMTAGASVRALDILSVGTEYVVQDLEGAWDPEEADGGIRHFVSANATLLLGRRVQLAVGPALGLSPNSPRFLGRMTATYAF